MKQISSCDVTSQLETIKFIFLSGVLTSLTDNK